MKPYYKQAVAVLVLIIVCVWLILSNNFLKQMNWIIIPVLLILIYVFINSFYDVIKPPTYEKLIKYKWYSEYDNDVFKTYSPDSEEYTVISWNSVEAIFLSNQTPRDGEYHNFRYTFILNRNKAKSHLENYL